jgi:hypothetical protein
MQPLTKPIIINNKEYAYSKTHGDITIYSTKTIDINNSEIDIGGDRVFDPILLKIGNTYIEAWSSEWGGIKQLYLKD